MKKIVALSLSLLLLPISNTEALSFKAGAKLVGGGICCLYSANSFIKTAALVNYLRNTNLDNLPLAFDQNAHGLARDAQGVAAFTAAFTLAILSVTRAMMTAEAMSYALEGVGSGLLGAWLLTSGYKDLQDHA